MKKNRIRKIIVFTVVLVIIFTLLSFTCSAYSGNYHGGEKLLGNNFSFSARGYNMTRIYVPEFSRTPRRTSQVIDGVTTFIDHSINPRFTEGKLDGYAVTNSNNNLPSAFVYNNDYWHDSNFEKFDLASWVYASPSYFLFSLTYDQVSNWASRFYQYSGVQYFPAFFDYSINYEGSVDRFIFDGDDGYYEDLMPDYIYIGYLYGLSSASADTNYHIRVSYDRGVVSNNGEGIGNVEWIPTVYSSDVTSSYAEVLTVDRADYFSDLTYWTRSNNGLASYISKYGNVYLYYAQFDFHEIMLKAKLYAADAEFLRDIKISIVPTYRNHNVTEIDPGFENVEIFQELWSIRPDITNNPIPVGVVGMEYIGVSTNSQERIESLSSVTNNVIRRNVYFDEDWSLVDWLGFTLGGIFDIQIIGNISLGTILTVCIGCGFVMLVLKFFAGG